MKKICSYKFRKIRSKTPEQVSFLKNRLKHECFSMNFAKFERKPHGDCFFNPLRANPTKWSNTLKQFVGNLPKNCLNVFGHSVR